MTGFKWKKMGLYIAVPVVLMASVAVASDDVEREYRFASGLIDLGFPDFAQRVVRDLVRRHPDQAERAELINAQVLLARGRLAEAGEIIERMPREDVNVQRIILALGNAFFRRGRTDQAREMYDRFFEQYDERVPEDPDLLRFYQESAYRVAQMQERAGNLEEAIRGYRRVLDTDPERAVKRNLMADLAALQVRWAERQSGRERETWLEKAEQLCNEIQWGGLDVPFGQSIITMARVRLVRGNEAEAREMLRSNLDILERIDGLLRDEGQSLRESPMAGARYLLGELYRKEGNRRVEAGEEGRAVEHLGNALREFYRVFAVYGESAWGPDAGIHAEALVKQLESMGRTVRIDLGPHAARAAQTRFRTADELFRAGDYAEAARIYVQLLNQFPENPDIAPRALDNLVMCHAHLEDHRMVHMLTAYIAERFAGQSRAALALRRLGKHYLDAGEKERYLPVYEAYFDYFPDDEHVSATLFSLASLMNREGDSEQERAFLDRIVSDYPDSPHYARALSRRAWNYYLAEQYAEAIEAFLPYVEAERPGFNKAQAQFCLADSYRQLGRRDEALSAYDELMEWLREERGPFFSDPEDLPRLADLRMKTLFFLADTAARATAEGEEQEALRARAADLFAQFVERYPDDSLAPRAMDGLGRIQLESGRHDEAVETYDELARVYPDSDEGRNALYSLIRAAMEVGREDIGRQALDQMLANAAAYAPGDFTRAGQLMLDRKAYPEAIRAFEQVSQITDERVYLERALFGLGEANYQREQYAEAIRRLEEFNERYPRSGLFYDARFLLGSAYRATGRTRDAVAALSDVFRYADDTYLINRANYLLGQVSRDAGSRDEALAAFQRVALLADPQNPRLRPLIRDCILEAMKLGMEMGRYMDVQESGTQFENLFPDDEQLPAVREMRRQARLRAVGN